MAASASSGFRDAMASTSCSCSASDAAARSGTNTAVVIANLFYVFVTLIVMINPVEAAAAFATLTESDGPERRAQIALRSTIIAGLILLAFGFVGDALLGALGISFAAFRIAGGLLLLQVGFSMVFAPGPTADAKGANSTTPDPTVFPLAIPIITGPGALTAIVTLMTRTHDSPMSVIVLVVVAVVVMAITYATMRGSVAMTTILGKEGVDAIGRIVGIIVTAIAIQIIVDGIIELLPQLLKAAR